MRSDSQRKRKKNSCEGNLDLLFSFSRFCFPIRNNGGSTNAAGISASPHMRGAFGGVDGGVACECASRVAARHGADAQGGWINGSRADDNLHYDFRKLFKEAGHNVGYQPTLPIPLSPRLAIEGNHRRERTAGPDEGESGRQQKAGTEDSAANGIA